MEDEKLKQDNGQKQETGHAAGAQCGPEEQKCNHAAEEAAGAAHAESDAGQTRTGDGTEKHSTETAQPEDQENGAQNSKPEVEGDSKGAGNSTAEERQSTEQKQGKSDAKDQKIEELTDKYKRLFAEFDNYRKRTDAEKSSMYADGQRSILEKILPIIDNFERAAGNVPEDLKDSAYAQGIEKVCRSSIDTLKALGVEPIEAVGQSFDANLHNAVMHIEDEEHGENEIVEEFQRGYKYKDKVIRYSMVKVAN